MQNIFIMSATPLTLLYVGRNQVMNQTAHFWNVLVYRNSLHLAFWSHSRPTSTSFLVFWLQNQTFKYLISTGVNRFILFTFYDWRIRRCKTIICDSLFIFPFLYDLTFLVFGNSKSRCNSVSRGENPNRSRSIEIQMRDATSCFCSLHLYEMVNNAKECESDF